MGRAGSEVDKQKKNSTIISPVRTENEARAMGDELKERLIMLTG